MNAQDAKAITDEVRKELLKKEYKLISEDIVIEARTGNADCYILFDVNIMDENVQRLEVEGYTLTIVESGFNESDYKISWA